jgi:tetratricopeptide (TPR) repeat protein
VTRAVAAALAAFVALKAQAPAAPQRGLTGVAAVARAYDAALDADFAALPRLLEDAGESAPGEAVQVVDALGVWWAIAVEPESRLLDVKFSRLVDEAIAAAAAWTAREPARAEAWFYLGAAYGARVQWRVLRDERLGAARDGKHVKEALERALALDPGMEDANYGLGLYRYYADIAPSALKLLRWLLLLPGGNRSEGLQQMEQARRGGLLVRSEAEYQLHQIYLWYEKRPTDALALLRGLQARYPHNPLFYQREAEILDAYFHDAAAMLDAASALQARAEDGRVHEAALAAVRARMLTATALARLGRTDAARTLLQQVIAEQPSRPFGVVAAARVQLQRLSRRR